MSNNMIGAYDVDVMADHYSEDDLIILRMVAVSVNHSIGLGLLALERDNGSIGTNLFKVGARMADLADAAAAALAIKRG